MPLIGKKTGLEASLVPSSEALCADGARSAPVAGSLPVTSGADFFPRSLALYPANPSLSVGIPGTTTRNPAHPLFPAGCRRPKDLDHGDHSGPELLIKGLEQTVAQ